MPVNWYIHSLEFVSQEHQGIIDDNPQMFKGRHQPELYHFNGLWLGTGPSSKQYATLSSLQWYCCIYSSALPPHIRYYSFLYIDRNLYTYNNGHW
jgi:hypothetical protein